MKVFVKAGVILKEINDPFIKFCQAAHEVWNKRLLIPYITSGADGNHKAGSKHFYGLAWDLRIWGIKDPWDAAHELRILLNTERHLFDVLYGDIEHMDHIHVEYDPK